MPKPGKNESKDDFIDRCIPQVVKEDVPQKDAVGRCFGIWRQHKGGKKPSKRRKK